MQYGYFDDKYKEYVITRPDTPRSWTNYLGNTRYGSVITQNAGGYSFFRSAAQGRFMRFRVNAIPMDQPGRYIYIRNMDTGDYWSASWQPVGKSLDLYKSECRHGTGYTKIISEYDNIISETTYFVPLNCDFEIWFVRLTNIGKSVKHLNCFTFAEYTGNWSASDDLVNIQYTQYTLKMDVIDQIIDHGTNVFIPEMPDNFQEKDQGRHTFFALCGARILGYDTDCDLFIGPHRTYANPYIVEKGKCSNSKASGDNGCGVIQSEINLEPGKRKELIVLMGIGKADVAGKEACAAYGTPVQVYDAFQKVKNFWHSKMDALKVETPDTLFNSMMNVWNPYNCLITYSWSRAASLIYNGERDGLGYRDSVQDLLGIIHNIPEEAKERLELLITGQVSTGGAMPVVKPFAHRPGQEQAPVEESYRSDDCMWLFNAVPAYVKETGDLDFYSKILPYADKGKDSVLAHLRRAIAFNLNRLGSHGLPCGLSADWNDCLQLGQKGESVFVAFQLRYALKTYIEICNSLKDLKNEAWARQHLTQLDKNIEKHTWDGGWYLRAYRDDGFEFGSRESEEGQIFLNPQTWAVISGHATGERAEMVMQAVHDRLSTEYGLMICDPPFEKTDYTVIRATLMNKGMKENGGIFNHTQGWGVIAESLLGNGDRAYQYCRAFLPASFNEKAEIRQIEPYVYSQSTHSKYSPRYGAARIPWLTGAATWAYYAFSHYIVGVRPDYDGLIIDPCIPSSWRALKIHRQFRNRMFVIEIKNPGGKQKGVEEININGDNINGNLIPVSAMDKENKVLVKM